MKHKHANLYRVNPLVSFCFPETNNGHSLYILSTMLRDHIRAKQDRIWKGKVCISTENVVVYDIFAQEEQYQLVEGRHTYSFVHQLLDVEKFFICAFEDVAECSRGYINHLKIDIGGASHVLDTQNRKDLYIISVSKALYRFDRRTKTTTIVEQNGVRCIQQLSNGQIVTLFKNAGVLEIRTEDYALIRSIQLPLGLKKCIEISPSVLLCHSKKNLYNVDIQSGTATLRLCRFKRPITFSSITDILYCDGKVVILCDDFIHVIDGEEHTSVTVSTQYSTLLTRLRCGVVGFSHYLREKFFTFDTVSRDLVVYDVNKSGSHLKTASFCCFVLE